jgi:hypothetical protein
MRVMRTTLALIVSIVITTGIAAAMLVDTLTAPAVWSSAPAGMCTGTVEPVLHTIEFIDARC